MIRSGSTLQYQLAKAILETVGPLRNLGFIAPNEKLPADVDQDTTPSICKLHHWDDSFASLLKSNRVVAFYSFRELHDVAVSAMRKFALTFEDLWERRWLQGAVRDDGLWLATPNVYSAAYQLLINDLEGEVHRMAEWMDIQLPMEEVVRIASEHEFAVQKQRFLANAKVAMGKKGYNPDTLLHDNHLHEGAVGGWRKILSEKQADMVTTEFRDWLEIRGYRSPGPASSNDASKITDIRSLATEIFVPHGGWFNHAQHDEVAQLLREGHYEADLQAFCWLYLRPDDHLIDVGSHFGLYSRLASMVLTQKESILAVEPHPETQTYLTANLSTLSQVSIVTAALGGREGDAVLSLGNSGYAAHSYLADEASQQTAAVKVTTLAYLIDNAKWEKVSLVKIDTEGREFDVLEGAGDLLGSPVLPVISLEFSEKNLLHFGRTTQQLARTLRQRGYQVCRFDIDLLQLVPVGNDIWPVWYENFVAVLDIESVNQRLNSTPVDRRRIAVDILARAKACQRVQELSQLETYREQATQALIHKKWAETAEANLATERKNVHELETWAVKSEKLLEAEKQRATEFEKWALKAEALAANNAKLIEEHKQWAKTAEAKLDTERKNVRELETWAIKAEKLLEAEKQRAIEFEKWALKAEAAVAKNAQLIDENRQWAETAEAKLNIERKTLRELESWAIKAEKLLEAEKRRATEFEQWAIKTEKLLETEKQRATEFEQWAIKTEKLLVTEKQRATELEKWALTAEARIKAEQDIAQGHKVWAEQTEVFLAEARQELAEIKDREKRLELQLAKEKQANCPAKT